LITNHLIDIKSDGSFRLDMSYFDYCRGLTMTSPRFDRLFGGKPRQPDAPLTQRESDMAASIQHVTERILLQMARHVHQRTGQRKLCLAGGVALNCVANARLLSEGPFDEIWIQPAAGDAGGALGVAQLIWYQLLGHPRRAVPTDSQHGSWLGPSYGDQHVRTLLDQAGAAYREFADEDTLCEEVAKLIASGRVVGWLQHRMEFGPRALGARSILADPRDPTMRDRINQRVKFRESFRPFAPAVLGDRAAEVFEVDSPCDSPYMSRVAKIRMREEAPDEADTQAVDRTGAFRTKLPAVTHVDGLARIQTVDPLRHGRFFRLLQAFERLTGVPVLLNTSFNVRDEPIVCSPEDALRCFQATDLDALVMERFLLLKQDAPARASEIGQSLRRESMDTSTGRTPSEASTAEIRRSAGTLVGLIAAAATWIVLRSGSGIPVIVLAGCAIVLTALACLAPRTLRVVHRSWMAVTTVLGRLLFAAALAATFFLLLTPIALVWRWFRRPTADWAIDRPARSYWSQRVQASGTEGYFRSF
jgi:carbamoyltransferase